MSNHFHLVVKYDPLAAQAWSDLEVAERWVTAFPPRNKGKIDQTLTPLRIDFMMSDPTRLQAVREKLGSLSVFMKALKQPIALMANREDGCRGHFFEQRFFSAAILSTSALIASMAYVDLNPVRAKIAATLEDCSHTSIAARLRDADRYSERLEEALLPLASGIASKDPLSERQSSSAIGSTGITLSEYRDKLKAIIIQDRLSISWFAQVASISLRQKAYGTLEQLRHWAHQRGQQWLQAAPLPE
ncbi:MAG: hypothetical protein KUG75_15460, partial [Pseudomonadales bacterium]|nr:hypothetical protein [Pseudomonadales bacterium]